MLVAVREGLGQYIELYAKAFKCKPEQVIKLENWKEKILQLTERNLICQSDKCNEEVRQDEQIKRAMRQIQENLVVVPVDKAGHNIAFVCKRWYAQKLKEELSHENGAYRGAQETVEDVLGRHKAMNDKFGFTHEEAFPYLYGILKAHKQPVQLRFIAGCSNRGQTILKNEKRAKEKESEEDFIRKMTRERNPKPKSSLTEAAKEGVKVLRAVMDTLREREEEYYKKCGVRKWWTVESIEEVALSIKDAEHKLVGKKMRTADFTTMYTKLPHQRLIDTVSIAWDRAVEYKAGGMTSTTGDWCLRMDWETNYAFQQFDETMQREGMTKQTFMELMEFLIKENHIWNGTELRKQVIGIPMGSPVSPHLANLFRYVVEAQFVEDLLTNGEKDQALACEHTFGFIDDLCTFEGPLPTEEHYGIPMIVDPNPRESVNFLGMKITANKSGRPPRLGIVEKQEEWNFAVIKYPHANSNIPWNQGAAVFKGQLIRYAVICNNLWDFQTAALRLAGRLIQRGHNSRLLIATWMKYLEERWPNQVAHKYRMQEWFPVALAQLKDKNSQWRRDQGIELNENLVKPIKKWVRKELKEPQTIKVPGPTPNEQQIENQDPTEKPDVCKVYKEIVEDVHVEDDTIEHVSVKSNDSSIVEGVYLQDVSQSGSDNEAADNEAAGNTQIFVNDKQQKCPTVLSDSSTLHDLMDVDDSNGQCEKCDGDHNTNSCPVYPQPPVSHPDSFLNKGQSPIETKDIILPGNAHVVHHKGDGSCLFHAMAHILEFFSIANVTGKHLRLETAAFIDENEHLMLKGESIRKWIVDMEDFDAQKGSYANQLRTGMWGGILEIQVVAHIYDVQFMVFTKQSSEYKCIFYTEPMKNDKGYLWYHRNNAMPHYDSLEVPLTIDKEIEKGRPHIEEEVLKNNGEQAPGAIQGNSQGSAQFHTQSNSRRRRLVQRNKLSLKRTTTEYSQKCGICGDLHTRRRTSILCICGQYVHLKCFGFRTVDDAIAELGEKIECRCTHSTPHMESNKKERIARNKDKQNKISRMRSQLTAVEMMTVSIAVCLSVAVITAEEQARVRCGAYIRLHGLRKACYNGYEGMVVKRDYGKAHVQLAGTRHILRVQCKNMTVMPTFTTSRCKLRKHCTVEITFRPEPVFWLPQTMSGNYYEYLGVERNATTEDIRIAFKKLSVTLHPDKNPNNVEKATLLFQQVLEAYECLKDNAKRMMYDHQIDAHLRNTYPRQWWPWQ